MKNNEKSEQLPYIIELDEIDSTNNHLRAHLELHEIPEGSTVVTSFQSGGKGQPGNSWESESGKNLLFSTIFYPDFLFADQHFLISQMTALSVCSFLGEYTDDISIKWPNDIYWKDKKICGVLIENDITGSHIYSSIIGIGININQTTFNDSLPNPVSLSQITGETYETDKLLNRFLQILYSHYLLLLQNKEDMIRNDYFNNLYRKEGLHRYKDKKGEFMATIEMIEPTGYLILRKENGDLKKYDFKEVTYILE